jgi:hypothetical protein
MIYKSISTEFVSGFTEIFLGIPLSLIEKFSKFISIGLITTGTCFCGPVTWMKVRSSYLPCHITVAAA